MIEFFYFLLSPNFEGRKTCLRDQLGNIMKYFEFRKKPTEMLVFKTEHLRLSQLRPPALEDAKVQNLFIESSNRSLRWR